MCAPLVLRTAYSASTKKDPSRYPVLSTRQSFVLVIYHWPEYFTCRPLRGLTPPAACSMMQSVGHPAFTLKGVRHEEACP
jgi:hypothetical protein